MVVDQAPPRLTLFKEIHYNMLMDNLPCHWSDVDEIMDLAEATQVEIDTCGIILPTAIAKIKKARTCTSPTMPT